MPKEKVQSSRKNNVASYSRQNAVVTQKLYANFLVKKIKNPPAFSISFVQSHLLYQNYTPDWQVDQRLQHSAQSTD